MTDYIDQPRGAPSELVLDARLQSDKTLAWWLYIFHAASMIFSLGAVSWIPLIVNYIKRGETAGSFVGSHHRWQIRSFWWYVLWMLIGGVVFLTVIGIFAAIAIWTVAWIWKAYRLIRGILDLSSNKAMPV